MLDRIRGLFKRSGQGGQVSLEVRPDGIAWVASRGVAEHAHGVVECSPARRQAELADLVRQQDWSGLRASLVLPMEQYQVFQMERPDGIEDAELADALRWKLGDLIEFSPSEAVCDVFPFPQDATRGRGHLVNVVVARRSLVSELVALVAGAGLALTRIDIAELALRNLAARLDGAQGSAALVHLRERYGQVVICRGETLYLSRRLDVTTEDLRDAARQDAALQALGLELQRSLDYFESQMGQVPPAVVRLAARDAALPLTAMLSAYVAARTEMVDGAELGVDGSWDGRCLLALGMCHGGGAD